MYINHEIIIKRGLKYLLKYPFPKNQLFENIIILYQVSIYYIGTLTYTSLRVHVSFKPSFALAATWRQIPFSISFAQISWSTSYYFGVIYAFAGGVFDLGKFTSSRRSREVCKVYYNIWAYDVIYLRAKSKF